MLPTVAEVLALDPVRSGAPRVLAGLGRLGAPVRWVHVIELAAAAHLLRGGELVLSTGIALPDDPAGLGRYVAELAAVGVSALAVELGSRYTLSLPAALISAAADHDLPLIVLERETQFIEITEAVHARIIDAQLAELRSAERLHQVFTELAVSGAPADEVVRQAAALAGCPVILENLSHQVLACAPLGQDAAGLLAGFSGRSRATRVTGRTGFDEASGWLVTVVGARGEDWGRLIMLRGSVRAPGDVALNRTRSDHAGARPAAGPPGREPGAAGAPDDPVHLPQPRLCRRGGGRGESPRARRPGRRTPAASRRRACRQGRLAP